MGDQREENVAKSGLWAWKPPDMFFEPLGMRGRGLLGSFRKCGELEDEIWDDRFEKIVDR